MTRAKLLHAQDTTLQIFEAVEKNQLIVPGKTEAQLSREVCDLAFEVFGINKHWHKKIVRTGANTMAIYREDPPNKMIQEDDMVFLDFGPIVDGYEADLGRSYVMGNDPIKLKLKNDVEKAWYEMQAWYKAQTEVKASDMFHMAVEKAKAFGWTFTGDIAGHIVGRYPHEQPSDPNSAALDIHPDNHDNILQSDAHGQERHWILELQFIDKERQIGAYFEQML
jgi:Xaa-Pro aminopeptidase